MDSDFWTLLCSVLDNPETKVTIEYDLLTLPEFMHTDTITDKQKRLCAIQCTKACSSCPAKPDKFGLTMVKKKNPE